MKYFVGIDPGQKGAMALIDEEMHILRLVPFDVKDYDLILKTVSNEDVICCLEKVGAQPNQGVCSMFTFGKNYGIVLGLLESAGIKYEEHPSGRWKKYMGVTADKNTSIELAYDLFPYVNLKRTERCRTDDDNIAEALLMAVYMKKLSEEKKKNEIDE